jgi:adenylyltransferase/sulfurtransferase
MRRYSRQILLDGVGVAGQKKLSESTVAIVGLGGVGCSVAMSLALMGVGRLVLIDSDVIEECNLHRQVLYRKEDIGKRKAEIAKTRLLEMNDNMLIEAHSKVLSEENIFSLVKSADVIIDGSDNSATRIVINRASIALQKPWIFGSAEGFNGMAAVFRPWIGPCYECFMQQRADFGCQAVLGAVPQIVGSYQAIEAVKLLLDIDAVKTGSLFAFDFKNSVWKELRIKKNPKCDACSNIYLEYQS